VLGSLQMMMPGSEAKQKRWARLGN
jgi:hypothetical protein